MKIQNKYQTDEKVNYRNEVIIKPFKKFFGEKGLPSNKQYWTLCGGHSEHGKLSLNSELSQIMREKLIKPKQFIGVDQAPEVIKSNKKVAPIFDWREGDFLDIIKNEENFNPGFIHLDTIHEMKFGNELTARVLRLLSDRNIHKCIVAYNVIVKNPKKRNSEVFSRGHVHVKSKSIMEDLNNNPEFQKAITTRDWILPYEAYSYPGVNSIRSDNARTIMSTFIFIKN